MKAKALLAAGLIMVAAAAQSSAQAVYSVNVVGFINLNLPPGFSLVANQLSTGTNTIASIFPNPPANSKVFKFNRTSGSYDVYQFVVIQGFSGWSPNGDATLNPGEGCFFQNTALTNITTTVVGSVSGSTTALGVGFSIVSSAIPQQGAVTTDLKFPTSNGDRIFRYDSVNRRYDVHQFFQGGSFPTPGVWSPSEPLVNVGESFFVSKASPASWVRTFSAETGAN